MESVEMVELESGEGEGGFDQDIDEQDKEKKRGREDDEEWRICCSLNNGRDEKGWKSMALSEKGRKAHLLEDKQIPSVGVFDEVFSIWKAFGGNTLDLGSFGEETNKTTDLHQRLSRISTQKLETTSQITRDAVITHLKTASQESECLRKPAFVCIAVDMSRKT
ncbi:hypothetical protein Tco_0767363 [Tanacetum coccineum]